MDWKFIDDRPIYVQIVEQIQKAILAGTYSPGSDMPSVRTLALEAEVNPNTMQKALVELEGQGLLHTQRTSGRTVTTNEELIYALKERIAQAYIERYFADMRDLGITPAEAVKLLSTHAGQEKNPETPASPEMFAVPASPANPASPSPVAAPASPSLSVTVTKGVN